MKNKYYVYLTALAHLVNDTAQGSLPALLPLFITSYGLNYQDAAGLIFANTALASILQPFFGWLADKFSKPWLVPLGIILSGGSISAMAFVQSYWGLFALATMAGVGSAIFHPEAARMVNRITSGKKGTAMGTFSVGGNGGFAVGPLLAGLTYIFGPHMLLIYIIINTTVAAAFMFFMPGMESLARTQEASPAFQKNTASLVNDWKNFYRLTVIIFSRAINFAVLNTFIPLYWISILKQPPASGNLALTIFFSFGVIVTWLGGVWSDRLGYVKMIRYSFILMVPVIALFTNSTHYWLSFLLLFPLGLAVFALYSPVVVLGQQYLAKSVGFASGITLGLGITIGGMVAPGVGWLADQYGIQLAWQILIPVSVIGLLFSYRLREALPQKEAK